MTVCGAILPLLVSLYNLPPICFKDMVILCSVEQLKKPKHMTIALRTAKMKRKLQSLRLLVASRSEIRFRVECLRGEKSGGTGGGGGSPLQGKKTRDKEVDALVQGLSREAAASSVRSFRGNITKKFTRGFASPDGGGKKGKKGKKGEKGEKGGKGGNLAKKLSNFGLPKLDRRTSAEVEMQVRGIVRERAMHTTVREVVLGGEPHDDTNVYSRSYIMPMFCFLRCGV